jgi:pimeloyl-ACP methyl ester carboxylesterase
MIRLRTNIGLIGVVAVAVVGCTTLDNAFVFQPNRVLDTQPIPPDLRAEDIGLRLPSGIPIHARWFPAKMCPDVILYCHGNAGNLFDRTRAVVQLRESLGESVLIFDYPGYGRSGGEPNEAGLYAAADAAYDWLVQKQGIDPHRIVLFGESLGGGVAVDLATRRPHRALVLVKTFTSVPELARQKVLWSPAKVFMASRFDNLAKIGNCPRPIFIAHGTTDHVIPFSEGERLFAATPNNMKQFLPMANADHNDPLGPEFYAALRDFLARVDGIPAASLGKPTSRPVETRN